MARGFVELKQKPKAVGKKTIDFDLKMAQALYNLLKIHNLLPRTAKAISIKSWADQFRLLRKYCTKEEITSTFQWYTQNLLKEFTPKVYSAKKFRTEFHRISKAMERHEDNLLLGRVKITPKGESAAHHFSKLQWPGREASQLRAFCQLSINNYSKFEDALKLLFCKLKLESQRKTKARKDGIVSGLDWRNTKTVQWLCENLPTHFQLIDTWLSAAHYTAWHYPSWNGDLLKMHFKTESDRFQMMMSRSYAEYRGDGAGWEEIWKQVQELMSPENKDGSNKKEE